METTESAAGYQSGGPNLRPADPVYVPQTPIIISQPKPKIKRMKRNTYYPVRQADQIVWLGWLNGAEVQYLHSNVDVVA